MVEVGRDLKDEEKGSSKEAEEESFASALYSLGAKEGNDDDVIGFAFVTWVLFAGGVKLAMKSGLECNALYHSSNCD